MNIQKTSVGTPGPAFGAKGSKKSGQSNKLIDQEPPEITVTAPFISEADRKVPVFRHVKPQDIHAGDTVTIRRYPKNETVEVKSIKPQLTQGSSHSFGLTAAQTSTFSAGRPAFYSFPGGRKAYIWDIETTDGRKVELTFENGKSIPFVGILRETPTGLKH